MNAMRMKRRSVAAIAVALLMTWVAVPAQASPGTGDLNAAFHAFGSGGLAILNHSEIAAHVASPENSPEGRLSPFDDVSEICDELVVGTWVIWFTDEGDTAFLEAMTNEFRLDGEVLELTRTPLKRFNVGPGADGWWFAEGVPVIGRLEPGDHELEWTFQLTGDDFSGGTTNHVEVDASHC